LTGREHHRDRCAADIGQCVDLGRQAAARTPDRMVRRFGGQVLVTRSIPFLPRGALRQHADGPSRWSSPPTATHPDHRALHRSPSSPRRTSAHRFHRLTSGDAVPRPTATHRSPPADHATANPCGTASRSLPRSVGGRSTDDPDDHHLPGPQSPTRTTTHH